MKLKRMRNARILLLMLIAFQVGWAWSPLWDSIALYVELSFFIPYAWFLIPLSWAVIGLSILSPLIIVLWDKWKWRRWEKDFDEHCRCLEIWHEILRYGNDYY